MGCIEVAMCARMFQCVFSCFFFLLLATNLGIYYRHVPERIAAGCLAVGSFKKNIYIYLYMCTCFIKLLLFYNNLYISVR